MSYQKLGVKMLSFLSLMKTDKKKTTAGGGRGRTSEAAAAAAVGDGLRILKI